MTRTVVTGAAGFIGAAVARRLVERGDDVVASDVVPLDLPGATCVRADITDADAVRELVAGADAVMHVASMVHTRQTAADLVWAVNHGGTLNVLDACRAAGVQRLVYVSSASVVYEGRDIDGGDESLPYASTSQAPYADSKIAAERDALAAHDPDGLWTCAIRPHVVYGPGDQRFMPAILERALRGKLTMGVGRAPKRSDVTFIDNLVDGLMLADERLAARDARVGGRAYFVTDGVPLGFWEFIDRVLVAIGQPPTRGRVPGWLAYGAAAAVESLEAMRGGAPGAETGFTRFAVRYMCTDHWFRIDRARDELGYAPAVTTDEGIARTVEHLRSTGALG